MELTKTVLIPDEVLQENLEEATIQKYKSENVWIYSITVTGKDPNKKGLSHFRDFRGNNQ